ncbi:Protein OS-9 [Chytridiales sp. JEL 0842]|nr:Protein OS-9 [Chytridiales sp. JEL 0842]
MVMKSGSSRYLCFLPNSPSEPNEGEEEESKRYVEDVLKAVRLVSGLKRKCLKYSYGWWSYDFCHMQHIKQFSIPNPKYPKWSQLTYTLGIWHKVSPDSVYADSGVRGGIAGAELVDNDEEGGQYLRMWYPDGDLCETGNRRVVEVQFSCCPEEHITAVEEVAVCNYVFKIHTPRLCTHPSFSPTKPKKPESNILCEPILLNAPEGSIPFNEDLQGLTIPDLQRSKCDLPINCNVIPRSSSSAEKRTTAGGGMGSREGVLEGAAAGGILPYYEDDILLGYDEMLYDDGQLGGEFDGAGMMAPLGGMGEIPGALNEPAVPPVPPVEAGNALPIDIPPPPAAAAAGNSPPPISTPSQVPPKEDPTIKDPQTLKQSLSILLTADAQKTLEALRYQLYKKLQNLLKNAVLEAAKKLAPGEVEADSMKSGSPDDDE